MPYSIAIDGPAGAGKSTIAKLLAEKLDFRYVDTGAMFRAVAVLIADKDIKPSHEDEVSELIMRSDIRAQYIYKTQHMFVDGEDVTELLRSEEIGKISSVIATYGCVREKLLEAQRDIASKENVIMDGRDIGSVVLPNADLKIYLSASAVARGMRRYKELEERGVESDLNQIINDIKERDYRDMNREIAPLRVADGAVIIDSSELSIEQVLDCCLNAVREKTKISFDKGV